MNRHLCLRHAKRSDYDSGQKKRFFLERTGSWIAMPFITKHDLIANWTLQKCLCTFQFTSEIRDADECWVTVRSIECIDVKDAYIEAEKFMREFDE
jgi:hypothetical protein